MINIFAAWTSCRYLCRHHFPSTRADHHQRPSLCYDQNLRQAVQPVSLVCIHIHTSHFTRLVLFIHQPSTMSSRTRPHLSITLPKNFTFHYTEGEIPKTPEQEEIPKPSSPPAYRIRRRARPTVLPSDVFGVSSMDKSTQDVPIPTIEIPSINEQIQPVQLQDIVQPAKGYLAPFLSHRSSTAPRTPSAQHTIFDSEWNVPEQKAFGDSITRPMSACSILSDSSDDSIGSSEGCPSLGGSCTSPESDAADPFTFSPIKKGKSRLLSSFIQDTPTATKHKASQSKAIKWTTEMDNHIWATYIVYLQDPTVTPFKMLPGSPPPLGVCHRVTREAKRTWRSGKIPLTISAAKTNDTEQVPRLALHRGDSPDTIKPERSGSNTPTTIFSPKLPMWPKSSSATRRRLRELCKRKATIAPHYQRLLQSRSPTPFTSASRSTSRALRMSSPASEVPLTSFSTRDIQVSLATSTATTMQRDGPLAQLTQPSLTTERNRDEWFNDPNVPWASPAPIPSEIDHEMGNTDQLSSLPRLGSPLGYHTWGPSRSRQHLRPTTPRIQSDMPTQRPHLLSPVQLHGTFPYPGTQKRRAQHQLEDELSPGGTDLRRSMLEELFGDQSASSSRRVRSRGFSLGDVKVHDRLTALFSSPAGENSSTGTGAPDDFHMDNSSSALTTPSHGDHMRRLGSPFGGISSRPSRARGRHLPTASLSSYDPNAFTSIDQRLGQAAFLSAFK